MTNYTDKQIRDAAYEATGFDEYNSELGYRYRMTPETLRAFLRALPDQADAWQKCEFSEYRTGDYLKSENDHSIYESKSPIHSAKVENFEARFRFEDGSAFKASLDASTFYRIPAPITRPNPEQYPIILAYEWETDDGLVRNPFNSDLFEWNDQTNNYQGKWNALTPEIITDWDPLEIASKEMTADD